MLHFTWCNRPLSTLKSSILFTSFFPWTHDIILIQWATELLATQCLQSKALTAFCFPSLLASVMSQSLIYLMTLIASAALEGKSLFDWRWNPQTCLLDVASWGPPLIDTKKQFNSLRTRASHINNAVYICFYWFSRHFITFFM